jgi:hypothetical protein
MNKYLIYFLLFLFLPACTVYTEKQSQALSRTVYATKDSLDQARIDLADKYSTETIRLVKPPKKRVEIPPVYKKTIPVLSSQSKNSPEYINKQRVLIIKNMRSF